MGVIKIEIEKSKDAKAFSNDNIIHQKEFKEALEWIEKGLAIAKEFKVNSNNLVLKENAKNEVLHSYNTITILGSRGSGKTTFLKSIIKKYENPFANEKQNRVEIIEIIDPTLIEEKGHIFLTVISLINSLVNSKLTVVEGDLKNITEWEKTVNFLAAGLPSMDGVGGVLTNTDWQDPEYIMGRGLIAVNTAFNLEVHFRKFISEALRYLEKDVFLIAFDDIDVDFRKGYPVIEMLRKYFTTPQIITFLTGDLHLYSTAIRKQKWGNFGKALLINEGQHLNRMQRYDEMVTELESQYLLKVLKPERRIHLTTMYEKTREFKQLKSTSKNEDAELGIFVNIKSNSNESQDEFIEIEKLYIELLSEFGIRNTYQVETYTSFLLALPVRTQIQFLNEYNKNTKNIHKINVFDSFLSDLLQKRVDTNLLNSSPKLLNSEILKLLLNEKELAEVYQLQPTTTDASLNASLLSLSLFSSIKIAENPFLIFDYLIKIGFVRNLLSNIPYSSDDKVLSSISSIEDFCKHSTVFQDKVLRDVSGSMNSYLIGVFSDNRPKAGFIPLPALAITSKKGIEPSANKIDRVFSNKAVSKIKEIIGFIPLSISASSNSKQSTATYSIYTVISTIGELIRKSELQDLNRGLIELSQIRTYLIPKFESGYKTSGAVTTLVEGFNKDESNINSLIESIENWVKIFPKKPISPHVLGKISTRFYYAMTSIENQEKSTNLGDMMHRRIVAFLNAILIEEVRENIKSLNKFNNNNPIENDGIFIRNLVSSSIEDLPLSKWLISCPLLLSYINPDFKLTNAISKFTSISNQEIINYSIYELLIKVTVKENQIKKNDKYDGIISKLQKNNVPFNLFQDRLDMSTTMKNNEQIRTKYKQYFGKDKISSTELRNLRRYLNKNDKSW